MDSPKAVVYAERVLLQMESQGLIAANVPGSTGPAGSNGIAGREIMRSFLISTFLPLEEPEATRTVFRSSRPAGRR